ncbi:MAG: alpha/beta fold hydrolase [Candidatus Hydrogenedentota bacterium]
MTLGSRASFFIALTLLALIDSGCKQQSSVSTQELAWKTFDGYVQQGTLYTTKDDQPPAFILVHEIGGSRKNWDTFAQHAQQQGFMCLAFDLRGHGDSVTKGSEKIPFQQFDASDWMRVTDDLVLAKQHLLDSGADPDNIFIVGASIGGNLAIHYGVADSQIQAVIALSPGLSYKGIGIESTVKKNRRLPLLLVAAEGDTYSASSARTLTDSSPSYAERRTYLGSSHGTALLIGNAQIGPNILEWIKPILK